MQGSGIDVGDIKRIKRESKGNRSIIEGKDGCGRIAHTANSPGSGIITTVAGIVNSGRPGLGGYCGDTGPAIDAQLANPNGVAVDAAGDIFIADTWNNSVREVNAATGAITTIAGGGTETDPEFSGLATEAQLNNPQGVVVFGNTLYIADSGNNVVRAVNLTRDTITTVVGDGTAGYAVNCTPTSAELDWPIELATDSFGNLFVADNGNNVVDEVTGLVNGTPNIITVAGVQTLDPPSYSGDGGAATSTYLNPTGVAVNPAGTVLYVSDEGNGGVRKVNLTNNTISTVAAATDMWAPTDLALDPAGNLFIADSGDGYIQEVAASTGQMTAVAGSGSWGYSGDGGPALDAQMFWPTGLAIDTSGDLFMTDNWNAVIREVGSVAAVSPTISLTSSAEGATVGQNVTFTATVNPPYLGGNRTGGTVDFDDGTTVLATVPVVSGEATYTTTTPLALGTHAMTAVYSGDQYHAASTSDEMDQEIDPAVTITNLPTGNTLQYWLFGHARQQRYRLQRQFANPRQLLLDRHRFERQYGRYGHRKQLHVQPGRRKLQHCVDGHRQRHVEHRQRDDDRA